MTLSQRLVNMLYALRDYSPLMTSLALLILPIALWPTHLGYTDVIASKHPSSLLWLRLSFVTTFLLHKTNNLIMYKHVGLSRVTNFQSQEVWTAPCKPSVSIHPCRIQPARNPHSIWQVEWNSDGQLTPRYGLSLPHITFANNHEDFELRGLRRHHFCCK